MKKTENILFLLPFNSIVLLIQHQIAATTRSLQSNNNSKVYPKFKHRKNDKNKHNKQQHHNFGEHVLHDVSYTYNDGAA